MKYLKLYGSHSQYVKPTIAPSIGYCIQEKEVHYKSSFEKIQFVYDCTINSLSQGGFTYNAQNRRNRGLILRYAENGGDDFNDYFVDGTLVDAAWGISANEWKALNCAPFRLNENSVINISMNQPPSNTLYHGCQIYARNSNNQYFRIYDSGWKSTSETYTIKELVPGYSVYYCVIAMSKNGKSTDLRDWMTNEEMEECCTVTFSKKNTSIDFYSNYTISPVLYQYDNLIESTLNRVTQDRYSSTWAGGLLITEYEIIQAFNYGYLFVMSKEKVFDNPYTKSLNCVKLASSSADNHVNNLALISSDYTNNNVTFMTSECNGQKRCFIESRDPTTNYSNLLQTISYSGSKFNTSWDWDWTYDRATSKLYAIGYSGTKKWPTYVTSSNSDIKIEVLEFNMPSGSSATLTDSDILNQYTFSGVGRERQDVDIVNGIMYYLYSDKSENSTAITTGTSVDGKVVICDLATQTELATVDLTTLRLEPEGCCLFNGELYVSLHQYGNNTGDLSIYKVTFGT